jgi:hypothetical protein
MGGGGGTPGGNVPNSGGDGGGGRAAVMSNIKINNQWINGVRTQTQTILGPNTVYANAGGGGANIYSNAQGSASGSGQYFATYSVGGGYDYSGGTGLGGASNYGATAPYGSGGGGGSSNSTTVYINYNGTNLPYTTWAPGYPGDGGYGYILMSFYN